MSEEKIPVTLIVLTFNEAPNIARCLAPLATVNDVVLVDSGSADSTLNEARRIRPDVRIFSNTFEDFGQQRNWALDNTVPKHAWVLFVDADEYCTPEFLEELRKFVAAPGMAVGAFISGKNFFLQRWLKHCTMYPSYQLRLLKLGNVRYQKEGHGQKEVTDGPLAYFKSSWIHNAMSKGLHQWIARHNQYSTDEAGLILRQRTERIDWTGMVQRDPIRRRRAIKQLAARAPLRPILRFFYTYVFRGGFLDGKAGLYYCALSFAHDVHISAKIAELRHLERLSKGSLSPSSSSGPLEARHQQRTP